MTLAQTSIVLNLVSQTASRFNWFVTIVELLESDWLVIQVNCCTIILICPCDSFSSQTVPSEEMQWLSLTVNLLFLSFFCQTSLKGMKGACCCRTVWEVTSPDPRPSPPGSSPAAMTTPPLVSPFGGQPPPPQQQQQAQAARDVNTASLCRIGQETVQDIVLRTMEIFQLLRNMQVCFSSHKPVNTSLHMPLTFLFAFSTIFIFYAYVPTVLLLLQDICYPKKQ